MNNKFRKNIKSDYIYCFIKNFDLSSAIWVLYLAYKGISLWQIGILQGIYHFTSLISEIPSGALADLIGRKKIIIIGRLFSAISNVIMLLSNSFLGFAIAFIFSAWAYNLNSGSEEALVYDSLKLLGKENKYIKVNSRLNVIAEVSQGISTFVGGIIAQYSYVYCYLAIILICVISFIAAFLFNEPIDETINTDNNEKIDFKKHFLLCKGILAKDKKIRKILLYYPIVFSFNAVLFIYGQQYFSNLGLEIIEISIVMLAAGLMSCIGALCSKKTLKIFKHKTIYIVSLLLCIGIISMFLNNLIISIIGIMTSSFANSILYPIQSSSLNKLIPSEQRATFISIDSMVFSLSMVVIFPATGIFADIIGLNNMFFFLGVILLFMIKNFTVDTTYM